MTDDTDDAEVDCEELIALIQKYRGWAEVADNNTVWGDKYTAKVVRKFADDIEELIDNER